MANGRTGWSTTATARKTRLDRAARSSSQPQGHAGAGARSSLTERERRIFEARRLADEPHDAGRACRPSSASAASACARSRCAPSKRCRMPSRPLPSARPRRCARSRRSRRRKASLGQEISRRRQETGAAFSYTAARLRLPSKPVQRKLQIPAAIGFRLRQAAAIHVDLQRMQDQPRHRQCFVARFA